MGPHAYTPTPHNRPYILCSFMLELAIGSFKGFFGFQCSPQFTLQCCNPLFVLGL